VNQKPVYERPTLLRHQMGLMNKFGRPLCANVRETSTRSEISVEGAMDLQDEEINQGSVYA
jgi:hypothetical protein